MLISARTNSRGSDRARGCSAEVKYQGLACGIRYDLEGEPAGEAALELELDHADALPGPLDEDTFSMAVVAVVRDCYFLVRFPHVSVCSRLTRMATVLLVIFMTLGFQVFLLTEIKRFVTAKAVHDIRVAYETFENFTYLCPEHPENCYKLPNCPANCFRGLHSKRPNATVMFQRLAKMTEIQQANACRIPLSQPHFFCTVLFLWSISVLIEVRKTWNTTLRIMTLPSVPSMESAIVYDNEEVAGMRSSTIVGLTSYVKLFFLVVQLIRVSIALYLLWIGCRWLLGTNSFSDLILNAVALEFVVCIKEMFYNALMPNRNKLDLENTMVPRYPAKIPPSFVTFIQTLLFIVMCLAWSVSYMLYFQQVLPNYNWDVHETCANYIKQRYAA